MALRSSVAALLVLASCGTREDPLDALEKDSDDVQDPTDSDSDSDPVLPPFSMEASAQLEAPALAVRTNLPRAPDACAALPYLDPPCDDLDEDGLVDAWEDAALELLRPLVRFDEAEPLMDDPTAVVLAVGRVVPVGDAVNVYVALAYHLDYGRCGVSGHAGDPERVVLRLREDGETDAVLTATYTAAHEGTVTDHGRVLTEEELAGAEFVPDGDGWRWRVYASDGKHATYHTAAACEAAELLPCLEEDCAPDFVADPTAFDLLFPVVNAGEPEHPRVTDLASYGFPDEDAWLDQPFCGGQGRDADCSATVRSKLVDDPPY